jgi:hypothetical protein
MRISLFLALLISPASLLAGPWIDDKGRSTEMTFPGATPVSLAANGHSVDDGVKIFHELCIKTGFNRKSVQIATEASGWNFVYRAEMMPFNQPVDVGGWNAPDAALRMADGIFFNKKSQCNLTFKPQSTADITAVETSLTAILGVSPYNISKQFDKKGKPKKFYSPEWHITGSGGATLSVFVLPAVYNSGAYQLSVLKN